MSINFGKEYKKFRAEQKRLREYYESLGMSKEVMDALYDFDKMQFCEDIAYRRRTQSFQVSDEDNIADDDKSPLFKRFLEIISVPFEFHTSEKFWWIQEIEDEELLSRLLQLSVNDLEVITYLVFEGYKQYEIAKINGVSQPAIFKKIKKIKKILKSF